MAIPKFMADYRQTWQRVLTGTADVTDLDPYFYNPCMMLDTDGRMTACSTPVELHGFLRQRLALLRELPGPLKSAITGVEVVPQGDHLALVRTIWKLHRQDGSVAIGWRQHYTLRLTDRGPKIMLSAIQMSAETTTRANMIS